MGSQTLREEFLQASSRMLFLSSPSTSRHLQSQSIELAHSQPPPKTPNMARDACAACGNLFIPGWTTKTTITTRTGRRVQKPSPKTAIVRSKIVSNLCLVCHRTTREVGVFKVDTRKKQSKTPGTAAVASTVSTEKSAPVEPVVEQPAKSSSKKRAKARKDHEGLQALLNKSAQNKPAPSLSLMDLMKR
ncbi:hypothetical protein PV08_08884 [Exophiala spinifera]|uniref:Uncharacterized protein n=1 Tax=Exophiala spinifera TaxID=91928 RepID=A0A0D2B421_9EURO|nr:uncharacterized protein PV08_08884 [Exophiala spinifera]KIW13693.1 hypothetical protein PV08_08884 [Exophiala spinifera]